MYLYFTLQDKMLLSNGLQFIIALKGLLKYLKTEEKKTQLGSKVPKSPIFLDKVNSV